MSKMKLFLLSLLAVSALSAVVSASALASPEWWVEGKVIKTAEKLASEPKVPEFVTIKNEKLGIQCSKLTINGGFVRPENKNSAESLTFGACKVAGGSKCEVEDFKTQPLTFPLEGSTGKISLNFRPTTGSLIAVANVKNCPAEEKSLEGKKEIAIGKGAKGMDCEYPDVEKEMITHTLNFSSTSGSEIQMEGEPASILGIVEWVLATVKKWSAL
jgi:hypothetical protein